MDLNEVINEILMKMKAEGHFEKAIKMQIEKTIEQVVTNYIGRFSDFGLLLEKQVKKQLNINLDNLDIPSYNHLIIETIQKQVDTVIHEQGVNRIKELVDKLLLSSKEQYTLSEIMEELAKEIKGLGKLKHEEVHEMTLIIDREYGFSTSIYFDAESNKSEYDCKYKIVLETKTSQVDSIHIREDEKRGEKGFKEFNPSIVMGGLYGLERTLFKMYARKAKLIIDEWDVKLRIRNPKYE